MKIPSGLWEKMCDLPWMKIGPVIALVAALGGLTAQCARMKEAKADRDKWLAAYENKDMESREKSRTIENLKKTKVTTTKEVSRPDGTKEKTTTTSEYSESSKDTAKEEEKKDKTVPPVMKENMRGKLGFSVLARARGPAVTVDYECLRLDILGIKTVTFSPQIYAGTDWNLKPQDIGAGVRVSTR